MNEVASTEKRPKSIQPEVRLLIGLVVPIAANALMWLTLFANPRLGFRNDLTAPFVAILLAGVFSAFAGIVAVCLVAKSRAVWIFLILYILSLLLNFFGFFWSIGLTSKAYS
jgi:hypothetical protein